MCFAQGHNAVMLARRETAAPWSPDTHSTTEPLHSLLLDSIFNEWYVIPQMICYIIYIMQLNIKKCYITIWDESWFFFQSRRNMISKGDYWYKENGRYIKHAYVLIVKCMYTFLAYYVSLLLVMDMTLNRMPYLLCFHEIIVFCFNSWYAFCLSILLFYIHLFLMYMKRCYIKESIYRTWAIFFFKMGLTYWNGTMAEINIGYLSTICLN